MKNALKQQNKKQLTKKQPKVAQKKSKKVALVKQQKRRMGAAPKGEVAMAGSHALEADHQPILDFSPPVSQSPYDPYIHPGEDVHSSPVDNLNNVIHPHTLRVKKLYRKMLRDHSNWYSAQYDNWIPQAEKLRGEFEKYRGLTDAGEIETVIREAEVYLFKTQDPMPYRPLAHPNGGLHDRNRPNFRDVLRPPPSTFVMDRDYHAEERVIRHLHAAEDDADFCKDDSAYGRMKVLRGEYWFDPNAPGTYNPTVVEYCASVGIPYMPDADQVNIAHHKAMISEYGENIVRVKNLI